MRLSKPFLTDGCHGKTTLGETELLLGAADDDDGGHAGASGPSASSRTLVRSK